MDQRDFAPRIFGSTVDLGAVEFGATPAVPPTINSAASTNFTAGLSGTFMVTSLPANPSAITFTESGMLPSGVSFSSNGTLAGTPALGTNGTYDLTITASNGIAPDSTQAFTLTINGPASPAPTTTTAVSTMTMYNSLSQIVPLSATVTVTGGGGKVNEGIVTFQVFNGMTPIGPAASGNVTVNVATGVGTASVMYQLPAGEVPGTYSIHASYTDSGTSFASSSDDAKTLTVNRANTTTANSFLSPVLYNSSAGETLMLSASVTSGAGTVGEGSVTFELETLAHTVLSTSPAVSVTAGGASYMYPLPNSVGPGAYLIVANYTDSSGTYFANSSVTHLLTINQYKTVTTVTTVSPTTVVYNFSSQPVLLAATVTATGDPTTGDPGAQGTLTFTLTSSAHTYTLPATFMGNNLYEVTSLPGGTTGVVAGVYTVVATYSDSTHQFGTSNSSAQPSVPQLTVDRAPTTTLVVGNATATFDSSSESVLLQASVSSSSSGVNPVSTGAVTFQLTNTVTSQVISVGAHFNATTGDFEVTSLPGDTKAGAYTISAFYNGSGTNFVSSSDTSNPYLLTISPASTTTTASSATTTFGSANQQVQLSATVASTGGAGYVDEGTVTFSVFQGTTLIGMSVTSAALTVSDKGVATVQFTLPGNTSLGSYSIHVTYNAGPDYVAPGSIDNSQKLIVTQASTSTSISPASVSAVYGSIDQSVALSATVTSANGPVNQGTVTFTVYDNGKVLGAPVTSMTVSAGNASALFILPGGTAVGTYTIVATYNGVIDYHTSISSNKNTLTVAPASTTTMVASQSAFFGTVSQNVTLSAIVTATTGAGPVNEGTVTFKVFQGTTQIGASVTSATVSGGNASVIFVLPASTLPGTYKIVATYNPSTNYIGSNDKTQTLTVNPAFTLNVAANQTATYDDVNQNVTLSAVVTATTGAGPVNEGTITFQVFQGAAQIGSSVTSATVSGGNASAIFVLPANTPVGTYAILATYSPAGDYISNTDFAHVLSVVAGPSSQFVFITQPPTSSTAGVGFNVVVEAEDKFGNQATSFNSNVAIQIGNDPSQGHAILNGTTIAAAKAGLVSFTLSIDNALSGYTLVASSAPIKQTSSNFGITPAAPAQVLFTAEPPPATAAGHLFTVVAEVLDTFGNRTTNYSGQVTVGFGADPSHGDATLSGALPLNLSSGLASFTLAIDKANTGYVLVTSVAGLSGFTSSFDVTGSITDTSTVTSSLASSAASAGPLAPSLGAAAAASAARSALVSAVAAVPGVRLNRLFVQTVSVAGGESNAATVEAKKVTLPSTVVTPPPVIPVKPPLGPVSPPSVPAGTGDKPPVAPQVTGVEPAAILQNDELWNKLDAMKEQVTASPQLTGKIVGTVSIAVVASLGYLLLAGRVVLWLILAMSTRPLWGEFDPLEVLSDWEKQKAKGLAQGAEEDESLQSMVEQK